jgi:hypothetical protein
LRSLLLRAVVVAMVLTVVPPPASVQVIAIPEVVDSTVPVVIPEETLVQAGLGGKEPLRRSAPIAAPHPFTMIGFELPDGVETLLVRARSPEGGWSEWFELDRLDADDGPDPDSEEAAADRSQRFSEPAWVGEADQFQVQLPAGSRGDARLNATVLDGDGLSGGPVERRRITVPTGAVAEAATRPAIVSRAQWGAQAPRSAASYASNNRVDMAVVHHTAGLNNYTREQAPGRVRSYQSYHRNTLGWKDIGYNALVDRFGVIYEGREGGLDRAVIGAHAGGYNTASFGVSVMGNFTNVDAPQAAYDALVRVIGWKAAIHGFDPLGTTSRTYNGNRLRTVSGHRDMGQTACPGRIQDRMWWIRTEAEKRSMRFPDVPVGSAHRDAVLALDARGIIGGYADNTFRPANTLTRAQMATVVARAVGLSSVQPDGRFKDVDITTGHAGNIHAVAKAGIVGGYPDGTFRPDAIVSRDQMATFLARARKLSPRATTFVDVPASNPHAGNIGALQAAGITNGDSSGRYRPADDLRRDQAASLVARTWGIK